MFSRTLVTTATAITQRAQCLAVFTRIKIARMTPGAAVAIDGVRPGHCLAVAAMTRGVATANSSAMIAGIVDGAVFITDATPTAGGVAKTALARRHKVAR